MEKVQSKPIIVLHIIHGMMEHSARYEPFAEWLASQGIAVYMADLPGHGNAVASQDDLGHIAVDNGWNMILESVRKQQDQIRAAHPGVPVLMLGHSFGSIVARSFVQCFARDYPLHGLILSGAMQQPAALLKIGLGLVAMQKAVYGILHRSKLMIALGHGQYAKHFSPKRTGFDWLSSDPAIVDAYLADPLCGYACTLGYYRQFFQALLDTWKCENIHKIPPGMPVLLMGGKSDPAIRFGKDTQMLATKYQLCGVKQVEVKLWEDGRHEMLNEVNKEEVWQYVRDWVLGFQGSKVSEFQSSIK